ncbi:MAG TPA: type II toxin-antitoxin system VapC family toxin [Acidimicrobiales bacterium]|nr:type II toxin-antitoxin system VapC family toxin [Acidimicrobiales bacterium]
MPTSAEAPLMRYAVDTSVAVPYLDAAHSAHGTCADYLYGKGAVLAGHAAFEAFAVLTRLPGSAQVAPADAITGLREAFGTPCWLSTEAQANLFERIGVHGLQGGAVYDALVGEAARLDERVLVTRDRRALPTYRFLGVESVLLGM